MGMTTRLYGCIEEYGVLAPAKRALVYAHNERIISGLPIEDTWPPLARRMFAITPADGPEPGPSYAYQSRVIHFGASFKSIEHEWEAWVYKFEQLLTRLLWLSATVHLQPEYAGIQTFQWRINPEKWRIDYDDAQAIAPITPDAWFYTEDINW
jgi:hypothetical protein